MNEFQLDPRIDLSDGVDEEGIVDDLDVETYYRQLDTIIVEERYLRVICDDGATDIETRIPIAMLEIAGFKYTPPDSLHEPSNESQ